MKLLSRSMCPTDLLTTLSEVTEAFVGGLLASSSSSQAAHLPIAFLMHDVCPAMQGPVLLCLYCYRLHLLAAHQVLQGVASVPKQ